MVKKATISFQVPEGLKKALEELAESQLRSLSNYIAMVLTEHAREKGYEWMTRRPPSPESIREEALKSFYGCIPAYVNTDLLDEYIAECASKEGVDADEFRRSIVLKGEEKDFFEAFRKWNVGRKRTLR
jgi:hypothetical protein